jgi:two-component system sensor histidine kinase YesM
MIASIFIFQVSQRTMQSKLNQLMYGYIRINHENTESGIKFLIDEMKVLSVRILMNNSIYNTLEDSTLTKSDKQRQLTGIMDNMMIDKKAVGNIFIMTRDESVFSYQEGMRVNRPEQSDLDEIDRIETPIWGKIKHDVDGQAYLLLGQKFIYPNTGQNLGYLFVYLKERALHDLLKNAITVNGAYSFLVSEDSQILSFPEPDKVGTTIFEPNFVLSSTGDDFKVTTFQGHSVIMFGYELLARAQGLGMGWKVIHVISNEELLKDVKRINTYSLIQQILTIIFAIIIAFYVSKRIIKPIRKLSRKMDKFGKTDRLKVAESSEQDELWVLEKSFQDMVQRINELIGRINEEKDRQREMELIALQAQINPHFLYNTLDAISWIAKLNKQEDIEKMITSLANFFRTSLHKGEKYITVSDEVGIVKSYLEVEAMRFRDKFHIEYDIDEDIMGFRILKIILQPLVENAIKHGIRHKQGLGHLILKGYREEDALVFEIIDDGAGFQQQDDPIPSFPIKGKGYGIHNVDERIRLEYGKGYGVLIESVVGVGTKSIVRVRILK